MRVIGGSSRGRPLRVPKGLELRPTSDRVREAIFDVLEHLDIIEGATVLDLFAGVGALGIEALSRGAAAVTLVDSDRRALEGVEANLRQVGLAGAGRVQLVAADARRWCAAHADLADVAFADPPYAYAEWPALLEVVPAAFLVAESNRPIDLGSPWLLHRSYRYGTTLVTMAKRQFTADYVGNAR